ncbi:MAG: metallophosphoesterase family protein [Alphaproteobacteria bacterium]|nr:metallophosphoesterase family protein [Alphaproteobacteria bacterium]
MAFPEPGLPPDSRLYAIGDIHGCLPLLKDLLQKIDDECRAANVTARKIFLGDYIDRGLYSRQTIDFLLDYAVREPVAPVFLLGNHEQVMRAILDEEDTEALTDWLRFGGRETMQSYGVPPSAFAKDLPELIAELAAKVPTAHRDFLRNLRLSESAGDYFFCHAGVRPGVTLDAQAEADLVWIRQAFLGHKDWFGKMVVHGHTIGRDVDFHPNRIGIDTGAYATGRLTALALEGNKRWLIQTA